MNRKGVHSASQRAANVSAWPVAASPVWFDCSPSTPIGASELLPSAAPSREVGGTQIVALDRRPGDTEARIKTLLVDRPAIEIDAEQPGLQLEVGRHFVERVDIGEAGIDRCLRLVSSR